MADVCIARLEDYAPATARRALEEAIGAIGGLDFVKPGMTIAVKANLVAAMKPEAAATTHPSLLAALTEMLRERGAQVVIGDSPGGLYTAGFVRRIYSATGLAAAENAGAQLNQDFSQRTVEFPQARVLKAFEYTAWLDHADAVINFCKLKSHGMMGMTAAAKNLFGVIPGTIKPEYHYRHSNPMDFARMIVDLDDFVGPRLSLCDAGMCMEGNGPTSGTPRFVGALLASPSPHKLDLLAASLIGLRKEDVPTLMAAHERGYIPDSWDQLEIVGDPEEYRVSDFQIPQRGGISFDKPFGGPLGTLAGHIMRKAMSARPQVDPARCVGCGVCAKFCSPKALTLVDHLPRIDRSKCIRCFCCQEFCPQGAMQVRRAPIARMITKIFH